MPKSKKCAISNASVSTSVYKYIYIDTLTPKRPTDVSARVTSLFVAEA